MHRRVTSVGHALVPNSAALAFGSSDPGMVVALCTRYAAVSLLSSELHVPRLFGMPADAALD